MVNSNNAGKTSGASKGTAAKGSTAGAGRAAGAGNRGSSATADQNSADQTPSGLNERTGEFNIGGKIIFGMKNGNINLRHSPQGDEVEVSEATLAGLIVDAFFSGNPGKLGGAYPTVQN